MANELDALLDGAARALQEGDAEEALAIADRALARSPSDAGALHLRAAALADLGRGEEAAEAYRLALRRRGEDVDLLLDAADFFLNRADPEPDREDLEEALALARRGSRLSRGDAAPLAGEFALVEGQALAALGDARDALARFTEARKALPDDAGVLVERGLALFELCRFEDAEADLRQALRLAPEDAWAHHALARVLERLGRPEEAERHFDRARELAPKDFPAPISMSAEEFEKVVEDALESIPEPVRRYLANVAIAVEDLPSEEELLASDPPLSPSILGIFRGAPIQQKGSMDPWSHFPSSISLYQRNLEAFARDRDDLVDEIGVTLVHEVGHFLGLDEEQLWERGLG